MGNWIAIKESDFRDTTFKVGDLIMPTDECRSTFALNGVFKVVSVDFQGLIQISLANHTRWYQSRFFKHSWKIPDYPYITTNLKGFNE